MSDDEGGLFGIAIDSDSDDLATEAAKLRANAKPRDFQTEEEFQALRATYRVKEQNGEIWRAIELPLKAEPASKPVLQELLHAVEELYYFGRFDEGASFARRVLDGSGAALDRDTREMLGRYEAKCRGRMGK
ncbi:hypothetical protein CTRI78_v006681 [Colletotrichum trifolii]|uniref:Uncharacterized protein n=1 Tax=Colletotrichum trifolii TaxID=5466 RepID=A0A4R8RBU6_COLTR|nr:hypothetical protein CTRI78_v006681 [Colletotrichum trifolii]